MKRGWKIRAISGHEWINEWQVREDGEICGKVRWSLR